ncbi:MAG: hypothetical protein ACT4TC_12305 [Myxococcaceae bacterium]
MKLIGKDFDGDALIKKLEGRLRARGLLPASLPDPEPETVVQRVDPVAYNLEMLEEHADAARPLPLETHRAGLGRAVLAAKWAFRKSCQIFLNEAFSRQKLFNGSVRDSYAQLSAEVLRLRAEVDELKGLSPRKSASRAKPSAAKPVTKKTANSMTRRRHSDE